MSDELPDVPLETNEQGLIIPRPVLGWTVAGAAGIAVILRIRFAETEEEEKTGRLLPQVTMTPQQALYLAETLTKQANRLLHAPRGRMN
jgi:hypothetical protein